MRDPERIHPALLPLVAGSALLSTAATATAVNLIIARPEAAPMVAAAAVVGVVLIWRPVWVLPAFVALTWAAVDASLLGGIPSPVQYGGLALAAFGAFRAYRHPQIAGPPLVAAGLLAVPLVISWLLADDRAGLLLVDPLRDILFLLIGAWCIRGAADVDRVLTALVAVGLVLGLGAIASIAIGPSTLFPVVAEGPGQFRAAGPFGEPNFFALSIAAIVPAAMLMLGRGTGRTVLGVVTILAVVGGILATGSRGALLAAAFAIVLTSVTGDRRSRQVGLVLLLCGAALMPLFGAQLGGAESRTVSGRATENRIAIAMAGDHPLTGVGPGGYPGLYRDYGRRIGSDPRSDRAAHSLPLQIAAEQGVVGVGCTLAAILLVVAALRRTARSRPQRTLALMLATYAVGSLFLHGSQLRLPYLLAGMAFALAVATPRTAPAERRPAPSGAPLIVEPSR